MKLNPNLLNDLYMSEDGEPLIGEDGDFVVSSSSDALLESCMYRLKTVIGDWVLEPLCGASLETLIGEPNSPDTATQMEQMILRALTHDGFLSSDEIHMVTMPVDSSTILSTIIITYGGKQTNLSISLDLKEGKIQSF